MSVALALLYHRSCQERKYPKTCQISTSLFFTIYKLNHPITSLLTNELIHILPSFFYLWLWIPTNICTCQPQLSKSIIIKNLNKPFLFATRWYPGRLSAKCTAIFLRTAASRAPTICGEMTFPIWSADPHIGIPSKGAASISSYQIRELVSYILITRGIGWVDWPAPLQERPSCAYTATLTVERTKAVRRESFMLFKAFGFQNLSTQKWVGIVCWIL